MNICTVRMRQPNTNIQMCTFVKIRFYTLTLNSIHTVHNQSMHISVKCLHRHYLSYKQVIYTKVYNEIQSGFGKYSSRISD